MALEKDLEERCRRIVEQHDGKLLKLRPAQNGWHDRLLLLPGYVALIEFKKLRTSRLQPLQQDRQTWCEARRIPAFRVWDYTQFLAIMADALDWR